MRVKKNYTNQIFELEFQNRIFHRQGCRRKKEIYYLEFFPVSSRKYVVESAPIHKKYVTIIRKIAAAISK